MLVFEWWLLLLASMRCVYVSIWKGGRIRRVLGVYICQGGC